jgi:hypothetical protein
MCAALDASPTFLNRMFSGIYNSATERAKFVDHVTSGVVSPCRGMSMPRHSRVLNVTRPAKSPIERRASCKIGYETESTLSGAG